jgi:hypothetical protein
MDPSGHEIRDAEPIFQVRSHSWLLDKIDLPLTMSVAFIAATQAACNSRESLHGGVASCRARFRAALAAGVFRDDAASSRSSHGVDAA